MSETNSNWFRDLFINEAKKALKRHSGASSGGGAVPVEKYNGEYVVVDGESGLEVVTADKYLEERYAEVVLPNATKIKSYAFCEDSKLETIHMPNVTEINSNAFKNCTKLVLTSMPEKLTRLSISAFYGCTGLKSIYLPKNLEVISYGAFQWCTNLNTVTFKGTPTSITSDAFKNCTNLKIINVPWAEGVVANAPWGATNATINYNYNSHAGGTN
jgi:hypothetical protein